jgi:purine-binding chemotaxis protein CheW
MRSGSIDWSAVHRRLEESERALERVLAGEDSRLEELFRERAEALARRGLAEAAEEAAVRVLTFAVGGERWGCDLDAAAGLLRFSGCTRVPGADAAVLGVMSVRGEIVAVFELGRLLGALGAEEPSGGQVLIPRAAPRIGLRVDDVFEVLAVRAGERMEIPRDEGNQGLRFTRGLLRDGTRVLDLDRLLRHPALAE